MELLQELVARDMKVRYKRTILGVAWSLISPLAQLLVLGFVFKVILQIGVPNYSSFLLTGLLAWGWFQSSLLVATNAILENQELIRQPGFPGAILPVVSVTTHLVHFLFALPLLVAYVLVAGSRLGISIVELPIVVVLQFAVTLGLAYIVAALHVTFRDTQYLLGIFLLLAFYLTPVFYSEDAIPVRYRWLCNLNPMYHVIDSYRTILIDGAVPDSRSLLALGVGSAVLLTIGYRYFKSASHRFVEAL